MGIAAFDRMVSMKPSRFYLGVFFVTASTLMLQVIQTRVLSVMLWYYVAFLVISLAMFGITAGTVWVYLRRQRFSERTLSNDLTYFTSVLAIVTALSAAVETTLAPIGEGTATLTAVVVWLEFGACLAAPFCLSGVVISLALTRSPFPIGRVYGIDLAGASVGCLGVLVVLNLTDGPSAILWVSAIAALGAICFAGSGIGGAPAVALPFSTRLLRARPIFVMLVLAATVNGMTARGVQPLFVKGKPEFGAKSPAFTAWNAISRISVVGSGVLPAIMWGPSPTFKPEEWPVDQRGMEIDGDAGTVSYRWDGNAQTAGFLKYDVTNVAHFLPGHKRAAVIGVGGGRDMLSARVFGVPDITGVELNPILVRLLTAPGYAEFAGLSRAPGMHFHVDEGRSWFARSADKFDIIQMSLVDTWAATGAGAFSLSENGLYTVDGWRIFLDHLTPNGVFTVSRWYAQDNVDETGRMVSLAGATLFALGETDIRRHLFLVASGNIATLVVSRSALSADNVALLNHVAEDKQYQVLLEPGREAASPVLERIVASTSGEDLERYTASLPLDLTPSTDERPFFFNQLPLFDPWRAIEVGLRKRGIGVTSGSTSATTTLILLFLISLLVVIRTIVAPLHPAIADVGRRLATGGTAYFLLIGAGFMFGEIALLQRLSVFLGHPIYSLSIVLFSLILTTGIGSFVSDRMPLATRSRFAFWAIVLSGYLVVLPSWLPGVLHTFEADTLIVRASLCIAIIAPAGILMGFGFPTGMRFISAVDRTPTPWFWGINGAAGVLASSMAVAISIAFGIYVTFYTSALCYALLIPAGLAIGFDQALPFAFTSRSVNGASD